MEEALKRNRTTTMLSSLSDSEQQSDAEKTQPKEPVIFAFDLNSIVMLMKFQKKSPKNFDNNALLKHDCIIIL